VFTKNTAFNKNFGTASGTVAQGNDSRIINGQTAYGWGDHASAGYALNSALSNYVPTSRNITAGNGLTGGGALSSNRTLTLGTPSNITTSSTNSVTSTSHTHNLVMGSGSGLDADMLDGLHYDDIAYGKYLGYGGTSYCVFIPFYRYDTASDGNVVIGTFTTGRGAGKTGTGDNASNVIEVFSKNQIWETGSNDDRNYILLKSSSAGGQESKIYFATAMYNGQLWYGLRIYNFQNYGIYFKGYSSNTLTPIAYYKSYEGVSILNSEIYNSITKVNPSNSISSLYYNYTKLALITDNVASATKLQTSRTIAGVSFDGTANIAIPFANLSSKPTTLGGYGITDAVTLNTVQTISAKKTFSAGLNIEGALNVTGVSDYAEGIRLHPVAGLSSIWFNAIENTGFQSGMFGMTVNASGMRFRYGTGVSPNDLMMILNNGNVGIGISSPEYKLDVSGTGRFSGTVTASISVASPKVIFAAAGWSMEQVGSELQMKHNNILKMRFTSTGSIIATEEITAFG
jgi:hypothetical protein